MIPALKHQSKPTAQPPNSIRTHYLFAVLASISILLAWANNEFVLTKEVFHALAGSSNSTLQADVQYDAIRGMRFWAYGFAPIQTAFRIGLVTLIAQMTCLLAGIEIPTARLFRVSAVAFAATLLGSFLQLLWIVLQPDTAINQAALGVVPDSIAAWLTRSSGTPSVLYLSLSRVSITSLLWMLLLYWGLRETGKIKPWEAATVTATTWIIVSGTKVGTSVFVTALVR